MRNLIPKFVVDQYLNNENSGEFEACSIFIDISGFTQTTEALMKHGKEGAEVLSDTLEFLFSTAVDSIYSHDGFITRYAGDAFTALLPIGDKDPVEVAKLVLKSANVIQDFFSVNKIFKSKYGDFPFAVKVGLSYGLVDWGIVGNDDSKAYYFKGYAVDNCAFAEHFCDQGDIVADENILNLFRDKIAKSAQKNDSGTIFHQILETKDYETPEKPAVAPVLSEEAAAVFAGHNELNFPAGEFRDAVSVFISFESVPDLDTFINVVIDKQEAYGGSHPHLDFGDKSGNVLVFFGAPISYENNLDRALKFILGIRDEMDPSVKLRAGICQGILYAGYNGTELRQEFTCLGNTVNQSARYMMKAGWGELFVSEDISKNSSFVFNYVDDFEFKGRAGTIPTYKLEDEVEEQTTVFIGEHLGRDNEIKRLTNYLAPLHKSKFGGIVYIDGNAGVGKSRLIHELKRTLNQDEFSIFRMRCDGILQKSFNPIIYFIDSYFNQSKDMSAEQNKTNFELKLNELVDLTTDEEISNELIRTKSFLGALLNIHWPNSLYESLEAQIRYENTLYAIKNLIKAESLLKPVVIELEDCHWVDTDTLNLLHVLSRNVENYPIIIISPCRFNDDDTNFSFELEGIKESRITLESLDKKISKKLIENHLKCDDLPKNTLNIIYQKSDGNPFYIEQLLLYLVDNKCFDEKFNINADNIEMPSGINAIIVARIDRLTRKLKHIVKTASTLGREFAVKILSAMLKNQPLGEQLSEGEIETIWFHVSTMDYVFKNALIRDVIYEMQLKKHLRILHALAGETMESLYKDQLEMYYSDLANHYEKAEVEDKALEYLEKAGNYARENYQNSEAITYYDRILTYFDWVQVYADTPKSKSAQTPVKEDDLEGIQKFVDISLQKAGILQLVGKWDESVELCNRLSILSGIIKDDFRQAKTELDLGKLMYVKGNYESAMTHFEHSLHLTENQNDDKNIATVVANMGLVFWRLGKNEDALINFERMKKIAEKQSDMAGVAKAVGNIGLIYQTQRNYSKAMIYYKQQLEIDEKIDDKLGISVATALIGTAHYYMGDLEKAKEFFDKRVKLSEELGDKKGVSDSIGNIGNIYQRMGDYPKALECSEKQLQLSQELGDKRGIGTSSNFIGGVYRLMGEIEKSIPYFKTAFDISKSLGNKQGLASAAGRLGDLYVEIEQYNSAMKYYDKAIKVSKDMKLDSFSWAQMYHKAELLFLLDKFDEANELNEFVLDKKENAGIPEKVFEGRMLRGKIEFHQGKEGPDNYLFKMLDDTESASEKADLHFELFKLIKTKTHQKPAMEFYEQLKAKEPNKAWYELDKRLDILKGKA